MTHLDQSRLPASCNFWSSTAWTLSQVPSACQSRSRRQQDMPDPPFSSAGRSSHGSPVLSTNRMPVRACRWVIGGRPPLGDGV